MAETMLYEAQLAVGDRAHKIAVFSARISTANGQAWVAAANEAARDATNAGLLIDSVYDLLLSSQQQYKGVHAKAMNDAFVYPSGESEVYNSNKLNVSYSTTLSGLPRNLQVTIPQRDPASYEIESNGINVVMEDGDEVENFVVNFELTALSPYGTAVVVQEITVNDS